MKHVYVIGHRGTNIYRVTNLLKTIDWIHKFNMDVLVVEQDSSPKLKDLIQEKKVRYIFAKNDGLYNRSWAFNIAHHNSEYDCMICADNDMVMRTNSFIDFIKVSHDYDVVSPFNSLYDLDEADSINFNPDRFNVGNRGKRGWMNLTSGICSIKKDILVKIGGWDERFEGWGGEDNAMTRQIHLNTNKITQLSHDCFHFFHPRAGADGSAFHEKYSNNLSLLREHEENKYTLKNINDKGKIDKYGGIK